MKVLFCGGAGEVGASCVLARIDGKNYLFDCGMRMGESKDLFPDMRQIQENGGVDAIFISHAHMDHIGALPVLSGQFPEAKVYMTHATKDLLHCLLYDSLKIMEYKEQEIPLYSEAHVKGLLNRIICFSPGFTFETLGSSENKNNHKITFYNAGHIAGAVCIYVTTDEGAFFYSGDFSVFPQKTVEGASVPRLRPDVAIFESTYGDRLHSNRDVEEERLVQKVLEVIENKGKILIPAFALGRAQEVILILKRAINKGVIPPFKIYVDGMVKDICRIYKLNPNYLRKMLSKRVFKGTDIFFDDNIIPVTKRQVQRQEIVDSSEPCCIITSSGMLTGGPSQWYAQKFAVSEKNYIAITGYQDEESPGRRVLELLEASSDDRFLKFGDVSVAMKCGIGKYGLSAHADKTQIIGLVNSLSPKSAFFVHGNMSVIEELSKNVQADLKGRVYVPQNGEEFEVQIHKKRKQLEKNVIPSMGMKDELDNENIERLWEFLCSKNIENRLYTMEELYFMWKGRKIEEGKLYDLKNLINQTKFFEPDNRRPFMFKAVASEDIEEESGVMEVNEMLGLVDDFFTQEMGLYKKGAYVEESIVLLSFYFPKRAKAYEELFDQFYEKTGWRIQLNSQCNLAKAQILIRQILGEQEYKIQKISYHQLEEKFSVKLSKELEDETSIKNEFTQETGIDIDFVVQSQKAKQRGNISENTNKMEQNATLSLIQDTFETMEHKLYKKSLKIADGQRYIELSFISPSVGNRYREVLDELEMKTFWRITVSNSVNQHEVLNIGRRFLEEAEVIMRKPLAFMQKQMQVIALVKDIPPDKVNICEKFLDKTGIELVFKV